MYYQTKANSNFKVHQTLSESTLQDKIQCHVHQLNRSLAKRHRQRIRWINIVPVRAHRQYSSSSFIMWDIHFCSLYGTLGTRYAGLVCGEAMNPVPLQNVSPVDELSFQGPRVSDRQSAARCAQTFLKLTDRVQNHSVFQETSNQVLGLHTSFFAE